MEYSLAIKGVDEYTRIHLKIILLSKGSQIQKTHHFTEILLSSRADKSMVRKNNHNRFLPLGR